MLLPVLLEGEPQSSVIWYELFRQSPYFDRAISMPTSIAEKLTAVIAQIAAQGNAELLRLTVRKKWFERPGRIPAFALWVASRAVERGRDSGEDLVSELFREAQALLEHRGPRGRLDGDVAERLYQRLRSFQSTYQRGKWEPLRIVKDANFLWIEAGDLGHH
jgi:hypothetical protein